MLGGVLLAHLRRSVNLLGPSVERTGMCYEKFLRTCLTALSSANMNSIYTIASQNLDAAAGTLTANYLAYYGVILSIWSVEAIRGCNALMPVQLYVSRSHTPSFSPLASRYPSLAPS